MTGGIAVFLAWIANDQDWAVLSRPTGFAPREVGWRAFAITTVFFAVERERWLAGAVAGVAYN